MGAHWLKLRSKFYGYLRATWPADESDIVALLVATAIPASVDNPFALNPFLHTDCLPMARIITLPPELLLKILSYLPIPSISVLQACSKGFHDLIAENKETVYQEAAFYHGLIPSRLDLLSANQNVKTYLAQWYSKSSLKKGLSWTTFCQRRANILRSWAGSRPSTVIRYHPQKLAPPPNQFFLDTPNQVHRIKVDELNGFFITTTRTGGLIVSDITTGKTLWNLPKNFVRPYAHLEYDNGYLVFDRPDGAKEVWRSESIKLQEPVQDDSKPNHTQELGAQIMGKTFQFVHPTNSNKLSPRFVPHGLLPIPSLTLPGLPPVADHTRVYRLVYPCLLAASSTKAYVWDIRTMKRVQTIDDIMHVNASGAGKNIPEGSYKGAGQGEEELPISPVIPNSKRLVSEEHPVADFPVHQPFALGLFDQCSPFAARLQPRASPHAELGSPDPLSLSTDAPGPLGLIRYVELSEKWVFVVRDEYLTLYKRNSDSGEPFTITPGQLALRLPANRERYGKWKARLGSKSVREHLDSELVKQEVIWDSQAVENNKKKLWDHLIAAHVSPDQQHLVLLTGSSRLIFIPFFERVIYRQAKLYDIAIDIQLGSSTSTSVYLAYGSKSNPRISVVTDTGVFLITPYFNSSPDREVDLTIHRVAPFFLDPDRLELVTCLMMSDTGLWLTWARGEGMDDTPEAERAMYAPLLQSRWASELRKQMKEEDRMLSTRSVEETQRNDVWQKRTNGKYAWKLKTDDTKKRAWSLFEWKFVRGLKTAPKIQTRMNGDRQVVMPEDSYEGEDVLWFQCAEVHQVKFT